MSSQDQRTLAGLPTDERRHVYAQLDPTDVLNLSEVCRSLRQAGRDEVVWEQFCRDRWFNPHAVPRQAWTDKYRYDNGWKRYALQGTHVASTDLPVGARWAFEWHPSASSALLLLTPATGNHDNRCPPALLKRTGCI